MQTAPCSLCGNISKLHESHIIPKFVFDWMKSSGSKHLRFSGAPNLRRQDGFKVPMLCDGCEQLFSKREKWFAENVFGPVIHRDAGEINYDESLFYFATSLMWRVLRDSQRSNTKSPQFSNEMDIAEGEWRRYLLGGEMPPSRYRIHMFCTGVGGTGTPPRPSFLHYMARAVDCTLAMSPDHCLVYAKFARFIFFGEVTLHPDGILIGTQIDPQGGVVTRSNMTLTEPIGIFLLSRIDAMLAAQASISPKQQEVIRRGVEAQLPDLIDSDLVRVLLADQLGAIVLDRPDERDG